MWWEVPKNSSSLAQKLRPMPHFVHRKHPDGTWDSICSDCHLPVVAEAKKFSQKTILQQPKLSTLAMCLIGILMKHSAKTDPTKVELGCVN